MCGSTQHCAPCAYPSGLYVVVFLGNTLLLLSSWGTKLLGKPDDLLTCQGRGGGVEGEGGLFAMDLTKLRREIFHD